MKLSHRLLTGPLLLALAAPAAAQQEGFYLTSPMSFSATRESKFIVDDEELSDTVMLVLLPTLSLLKLNPRGELALSYQPELQAYASYRDLTVINHSGELLFAQRLDQRLSISAGDTFLATSDPSRLVLDSVMLLPRERMTQNTFYFEISRRFGNATSVSVRGDNTITRIADPQRLRPELTDRMGTSGSFSLSQVFARRHMVTATYAYIDARAISQPPIPIRPIRGAAALLIDEPQQAHSTAMGYAYQGDSLAVRFAGGIVFGKDIGYTGSGEIEKRLGKDATLSLIAQRSLTFFGGVLPAAYAVRLGSGLAPLTFFEAATLRLRGDLSRKISTMVEVSGQRTFSDVTAFTVQSDFARGRLDYHVNRTLALFGIAELYRQSYNEFVGVPLNWTRFGAGITIAPSVKPNPLERRHEERRMRERRLRRGEPLEEEAGDASSGLSGESQSAPPPDPMTEGDSDVDTGTRY